MLLENTYVLIEKRTMTFELRFCLVVQAGGLVYCVLLFVSVLGNLIVSVRFVLIEFRLLPISVVVMHYVCAL